MINMQIGGRGQHLDDATIKNALAQVLARYGITDAQGAAKAGKRILAIPPDFTRFHSYAGRTTELLYELAPKALTDVLPALGTHRAMSPAELREMYGAVPLDRFRVHDWRNDLATVGTVPRDFVHQQSGGAVDYEWPAQLNRTIVEGGHDLVLSIGQVVPHEVVGMANHAKNIFVGTGGRDGINRSHFLGAAYGMERIMGRADNPVRAVLNYAAREFMGNVPLVYVLTVVSADESGHPVVRGLFIGEGLECFYAASELALQENFTMLEEAPQHMVVYLDPSEFKSTWLGNKSIYRTRMAVADGGMVTVLAPGVEEFGEDKNIDRLIRRHGYRGTDATMAALKADPEIAGDLSAAAHLIHGTADGRFTIRYAPGKLTRAEIESVGYTWGDLAHLRQRYNPAQLKDGWNTLADGERIFFISNPALGLWSHRARFGEA